MAFDPEIHKVKEIIIKCGRALREAKGLPEELNISILYREASLALGLPLIQTTTADADHLPAPHEMLVPGGQKFVIPRKDCPQCGRKGGLSLKSICPSCTDSEDGKYHTMYSCEEMGMDRKLIGCGFKTDRSEKFMVQRMSEENPNWEGGMKQGLGIKTITDDGIK